MKLQHGAYILARYSTDRQNPDSIEVQVERCTKWCQEHQLPVLDVFADYAVSGMKDTRPQQERMMQQLRQGGADTVVIYDQSRMFRRMSAWFEFRDALEDIGAQVVSVTQPMVGQDLSDPANFVSEGAMALFNQMWALQTRQKVVEKMRFMATHGSYTGGVPPLGYQVVEGRLAIQPEEADTVRRIFALYADGNSYRDIISILNREGRTTKTGGVFGSNSLHDLLKNEKYIGVLVYGKTKKRRDGSRNTHGEAAEDTLRIDGVVPAIIDRATWELVQIRMEHNRRAQSGRPPTRRAYPLAGKVFCVCGSSMYVRWGGSTKRYPYYDCAAKHRNHTCDSAPISADLLERTVAEAIRKMLGEPDNIEELRAIVRKYRDEARQTAAPRLAALIRRRRELQASIDNGTKAILNGLYSPTLATKLQELEADLQQVDEQTQALRKEADIAGAEEEDFEQLVDGLIAYVRQIDAELLQLVYRVVVTPDYIQIWTLMDIAQDGPQKEAVLRECHKLMVPADCHPQFFARWRMLVFSVPRPRPVRPQKYF